MPTEKELIETTENIKKNLVATLEQLHLSRVTKQMMDFESIKSEIHLRNETGDKTSNILINIDEDDNVTIEGSYSNIHIIRRFVDVYLTHQDMFGDWTIERLAQTAVEELRREYYANGLVKN